MMPIFETSRDGYVVSTDPARLDLDLIHRVLSTESYWAAGRPRETTERAFAHSLPFGLHAPDGTLAGWARVITDHATFGYLADVWIQPAHRGRGLSKFLVGAILEHPGLGNLRRWTLFTKDAHGLYAQFGFGPIAEPHRAMERRR